MARPVSIDRTQILLIARELFLSRGMSVSVGEVAQACGVAEGTLFRHFDSKAGLLVAALHVSPPDWVFRLPERVGRKPIEDELCELFGEVLVFFRCLVPLAMMSWSEPGLRERMHGQGGPASALGAHRALAEYLQAEMDLGRIVRVDPASLSMILSGSLWNYCSMEVLFNVRAPELPDESKYLEGLTRLVTQAGGSGSATLPSNSTTPRSDER